MILSQILKLFCKETKLHKVLIIDCSRNNEIIYNMNLQYSDVCGKVTGKGNLATQSMDGYIFLAD